MTYNVLSGTLSNQPIIATNRHSGVHSVMKTIYQFCFINVNTRLDYCNSLFIGMTDRNFQEIAACTEYISTSCPACWQVEVRTHHSSADSTSLAAGQTTGPVQTGSNNIQCFATQ